MRHIHNIHTASVSSSAAWWHLRDTCGDSIFWVFFRWLHEAVILHVTRPRFRVDVNPRKSTLSPRVLLRFIHVPFFGALSLSTFIPIIDMTKSVWGFIAIVTCNNMQQLEFRTSKCVAFGRTVITRCSIRVPYRVLNKLNTFEKNISFCN
jgi:hypothetical protein